MRHFLSKIHCRFPVLRVIAVWKKINNYMIYM